jgi:pimeloyl-ACP methyl ester carboxylesterase
MGNTRHKVTLFVSCFLLAFSALSATWAGDVPPFVIMQQASDAPGSLPLSRASVNRTAHGDSAAGITVRELTDSVRRIHEAAPDVPASVLGAVWITPSAGPIDHSVRVPLIRPVPAGTELEVVRANLTAVAWAETGLTAVVGEDARSASFRVTTPGVYAVYNPERRAYLEQKRSRANHQPVSFRVLGDDEPWGLISENAPSAAKIPLILVHGDNSFREKEDRWDLFLDWVDENPDFGERYEIWRFHHDTRELIGYDGASGNAQELGDAILDRFGADRPILILAHSRGGLVARAYLCNYGDGAEGDRVLGLVTLGTPHHGSPGAVPEWGLETVKGQFKDTELAEILYGLTASAVVNVTDQGTMGLAWDNFDGPENGIGYNRFDLDSEIGDDHVLSVADANVDSPELGPSEPDPTIYLPDRALGTLEALNADERYFGRMIAYGGYKTDLGLGGHNPFDWLNFSISDHIGLEMAIHVMANIHSRSALGPVYHYVANDGMVPLQSAFLLKKDAAGEPMYDVDRDRDFFVIETYEVKLRDVTSRMNVRKAVVCPDFDHLDMTEGKGGLLSDRADFWDHVAEALDELAGLSDAERQSFTPETTTFRSSSPSFSSLSSGDNCFIQAVRGAEREKDRSLLTMATSFLVGIGLIGGLYRLSRRRPPPAQQEVPLRVIRLNRSGGFSLQGAPGGPGTRVRQPPLHC